ncbi:probable phospholipase A2 homolog 2 [Phragmites australis]|uniref:probable phospholipase A2 homolog 2 n=1 Tax=Phragmites australis TaxID=29695 RepID=UPI002D79C9D6|nr:probable phospholipase A2 homolog 2 [Phragmites australis]
MARQMGGCAELAGRHPLHQRRPLLLPPLLLLLVAVADQHLLAGASFFGGDSASECSRTCESEHCTVAPLMRYGKYCGVSYTGCPGEAPCDAVDACCMLHDGCVQATDDDYLNMWCNQSLLDCVAAARTSGATTTTFQGNQCNVTEVADGITSVVEAAVFAKRIFHKP